MEFLQEDLHYRSKVLNDIFDCCICLSYFDCSNELIIKFKGRNFYNLIHKYIDPKIATELKKRKIYSKTRLKLQELLSSPRAQNYIEKRIDHRLDIIHDYIHCFEDDSYSYNDYLKHYENIDIVKYLSVFKNYIINNVPEVYCYFSCQKENEVDFVFNQNEIIISDNIKINKDKIQTITHLLNLILKDNKDIINEDFREELAFKKRYNQLIKELKSEKYKQLKKDKDSFKYFSFLIKEIRNCFYIG